MRRYWTKSIVAMTLACPVSAWGQSYDASSRVSVAPNTVSSNRADSLDGARSRSNAQTAGSTGLGPWVGWGNAGAVAVDGGAAAMASATLRDSGAANYGEYGQKRSVYSTASAYSETVVVFKSPTGSTDPIPARLRFHLSGTVGTTSDPIIGGGGSRHEATAHVNIRFHDAFFYDESYEPWGDPLMEVGGTRTVDDLGPDLASGIFTTMQPDADTGTAGEVWVTPGRHYMVSFGVSTTAHIYNDFHADGLFQAIANFGNTLSFAEEGAAFELPAGITVDSLGGAVVDNRLVQQVPSVPEPASLSLLALGGFALLRRRGLA